MKKQLFFITLLLLTAFACAQKKPIKVACVGNSITYGYGIENREQNSYPSVLQRQLGISLTFSKKNTKKHLPLQEIL